MTMTVLVHTSKREPSVHRLEHFLDPRTSVTLAYEDRRPEHGYSKFSTTDGGLTTLRLQVKY